VVDIADSLLPLEFTWAIRTFCFFLIFAGLAWINIRGVEQGVTLVKMITLAKLAPLVLFILFTSKDIQFQNLVLDKFPPMQELGKVSLILFFAFQGSEGGLSVSGEVRNPQKTIPRAILIAISGALILYLLIQTVSIGVLGPSLSQFKENPLGQVANQVIGPVGLTLMIVGAGISMCGNLSSEILSMPRMLYGAAKDRIIPIKALASIHPKFATPYISIMAMAGLDFLFASFGGFEQLAILSSATVLLVYFGMAVAVIMLRRQNRTKPEGSFRIPGGYLVPVAAAGVIIWFLSNLTRKDMIGGAAIIAFLSLIYFTLVRRIKNRANKP